MFSKDKFIEDCIKAVGEGKDAVQEIVADAISDPGKVKAILGEQQFSGLHTLYRAPNITILNIIWAPYMSLMPHNHQMFSVVGIYSGREDNIFWERSNSHVRAVGAKSLGPGEVSALDKTSIHSVFNPIGKMTGAIHVYGGDFFAPEEPRSEWDHETLLERPWDVERAKTLFREAEDRFYGTTTKKR